MPEAVRTEITVSLRLGVRKRCWVDPALRVLSWNATLLGRLAALIATYGIVAEVRPDAAR